MGEGNHKKANQYFKLVAAFNFILNLLIAIIVYFCRDLLARVYTSNEELIPLISDAYTIMLFILMLHGLAMVQAGAARGLGMIDLANWVVFFAFYVVSLPAAYLFTFTWGMGMLGLWWGITLGSASEIILYCIFLKFMCDWKKLAGDISRKMKLE